MTAPKKSPGAHRLTTEALLRLVRGVAERLSRLSRDPHVRQEALNVSQAVGRLLRAIGKANSDSR